MVQVYSFYEDMKKYIVDGLNADADISKTYGIVGYDANTKGHTPTKTEVQFQIMDNNEVERFTSFDGANIYYIPLQITVWAFTMKLAGTMTVPRVGSVVLGDKIIKLLDAVKVVNANPRVKRVRIMTTSPAMPFEGGDKAYTTAIRCEFWVAKE
jgi:hypothetical protein